MQLNLPGLFVVHNIESRVKKYDCNRKVGEGLVIYWMQRDQRVQDNWALIYASQLADKLGKELIVVFNIVPDFLQATWRQYAFMLRGIKKVSESLAEYNIPFKLFMGDPGKTIPYFAGSVKASVIVSDFNPLHISRFWKKEVQDKIEIPLYTVDAHNIVPAWVTSEKEEFAAYTIRPKIHKLIPEYLGEFPQLQEREASIYTSDIVDVEKTKDFLNIDFSVDEVNWLKPGEDEALLVLDKFISEKIVKYDDLRNDPVQNYTSNLSPYLHFGQISAQRIVLEVERRVHSQELKDKFIEELVVRRELADNYCLYNKNYDNFNGLRDWAKTTLNDVRNDKREHIYSTDEFEFAQTHDPLWNAAQIEMVKKGKMHGYMRMYWAKKILEWTKCPEDAIKIAIYLNDKYELDGRDPNGYTGVMWSVGGIHDRAWASRPVFGKIRYMNYNGCKRKFDVKTYINKQGVL